jgi:hypothetical protein
LLLLHIGRFLVIIPSILNMMAVRSPEMYISTNVSGHYPSSCLYLKTPSRLFFKTTFRRLDSVSVFRYLSSGPSWVGFAWRRRKNPVSETLSVSPEIGTSSINWAQVSRFFLKTETESSVWNFILKNKQDGVFRKIQDDNVQKHNICTCLVCVYSYIW